ncbi:Outer membrane protein OmpA [Lampropedia hyalina DSM 16112]|jgi:outer membrane protein OmpA-like peptidoglycan-associated protein|uniref:Outer membrane protein OmpA n=1 Tax=Lampropedia hyalina DSM 16112 TaxID=1122156 RepID=A0A1M4V1D7_9BURK|nr:OmpA family protein [Lampropedia hyalina]SHE62794.1 Outer membrane protein OmpA [Lampropedia hyalina DSM 16112]
MSENKDSETRIALLVVSALIAAVVIGVVWFGAAQSSKGQNPAAVALPADAPPPVVAVESVTVVTVTEEAPVAQAEEARADEAYVVVEDAVVKFYFATGKAEIPANAAEALLDIVAAANSGKKIVISGFTDATGNVELNEELAKQRAFAVRDALTGLNVPEETLELRKPENLTGTGNPAEARRVEVRVTD